MLVFSRLGSGLFNRVIPVRFSVHECISVCRVCIYFRSLKFNLRIKGCRIGLLVNLARQASLRASADDECLTSAAGFAGDYMSSLCGSRLILPLPKAVMLESRLLVSGRIAPVGTLRFGFQLKTLLGFRLRLNLSLKC